MRLIDEEYTRTPFYGSRKITALLRTKYDYSVNRKRIQRLMRLMGISAIYPSPRTTIRRRGFHKKYPYLLGDITLAYPNHAWGSDITYIRLRRGFIYLVAIIDLFSRYVISWRLSNSLDTEFCLLALDDALRRGPRPLIFNADQGCQYTSDDFIGVLDTEGISLSLASRGRCFDNIIVERLWRSLKYEEVYTNDYETVGDAVFGIGSYLEFFNNERLHQSLGYKPPSQVFHASS